jgi:2,5-furandicarboxylate decarboxylase 1
VPGRIPTTAKMGIDATIPEDVPKNRYNRIVYFNEGKARLKDYLGSVTEPEKAPAGPAAAESVETMCEKIMAALRSSHRFFAELLALFPDAEYRNIAAAVGRLQHQGTIQQDAEGKYQATEQARHG